MLRRRWTVIGVLVLTALAAALIARSLQRPGTRSMPEASLGELDNNILAGKNRAAWEAALKAGGHRDYTLRILPKANHALLEASVGNNAEMKSLQRFVPAYFEVVLAWLSNRISGLAAVK